MKLTSHHNTAAGIPTYSFGENTLSVDLIFLKGAVNELHSKAMRLVWDNPTSTAKVFDDYVSKSDGARTLSAATSLRAGLSRELTTVEDAYAEIAMTDACLRIAFESKAMKPDDVSSYVNVLMKNPEAIKTLKRAGFACLAGLSENSLS